MSTVCNQAEQGLKLLSQRRYKQAYDVFDAVLKENFANTVEENKAYIDCLAGRSYCSIYLDKMEQVYKDGNTAIAKYEELKATISDDNPYLESVAMAHLRIAQAYDYENKLAEAFDNFRLCLSYATNKEIEQTYKRFLARIGVSDFSSISGELAGFSKIHANILKENELLEALKEFIEKLKNGEKDEKLSKQMNAREFQSLIIALLRVYYKKLEIVKALVECGFQMIRWDVIDGFSSIHNLIPTLEYLIDNDKEAFVEILEYTTFSESKYFEKMIEKLIPLLHKYLPVEKTEQQTNILMMALGGCMVDIPHTKNVATEEVIKLLRDNPRSAALPASGRIAMEPIASMYLEEEHAVDWVYDILKEKELNTDMITSACLVLARNVCILDKKTMKGVDYDTYKATEEEVRKCERCIKELTPLLKKYIKRSDYVSNIYLVLNFAIRVVPEVCKSAGLVMLSSLAMATCANDPHVVMNVSSFLCVISELAVAEMKAMPGLAKTVQKVIGEHQKKYPEAVETALILGYILELPGKDQIRNLLLTQYPASKMVAKYIKY